MRTGDDGKGKGGTLTLFDAAGERARLEEPSYNFNAAWTHDMFKSEDAPAAGKGTGEPRAGKGKGKGRRSIMVPSGAIDNALEMLQSSLQIEI